MTLVYIIYCRFSFDNYFIIGGVMYIGPIEDELEMKICTINLYIDLKCKLW